MIKNKASWVALGVLAIATALMVFVVQPNLRESDEGAAQSVAGGKTGQTAPTTKTESPSAIAQQGTAGEQAKGAAGNAAPDASETAVNQIIPGFDILRVEPDGSTVVAGRAEPGTKLEILSGDKVVGTADVGAAGDFAAVFDKPLAAGDHQLTLRSVGPDGATRTSEEVATISVPQDPSGQLLAMVSKPGEASRLITTPKAETKPMQAKAEPAVAAASVPLAKPNGVPGLQVTAVEIEGGTMYVAGNAKPGSLVRIYADDRLLGEMKTDDKGHFVVDGSIELSVGSHIIRADMMNEDASKVAMRASVPFDRPAGAQVAAIAGPSDTPVTALGSLKTEAGKALALLRGLFADGKQPSAEQLAAARSATEFALQSLAEFKPAPDADPALAKAAAETSKAAASALTALKSSPPDPASVAAALQKVDGAIASALTQQSLGTAVATVELPAVTGSGAARGTDAPKVKNAEEAAAPAAQQAAASDATQEQPATIEQAPLKESKTSVIIRRGDTLWQISRRVYGAGVRYTTIYLANREQIGNPDLIRPGQVFGVPDEVLSDEESREIHRKHMRH
ncbi:LysM peptidoglycan-binding domain-containing protein [Bradyrhizobium sp. BRP14]|nr:LysM peptidoglycan-binding domain-containing protein [Bradyrhizobium sp. BRP14]